MSSLSDDISNYWEGTKSGLACDNRSAKTFALNILDMEFSIHITSTAIITLPSLAVQVLTAIAF